MCIPLHGFAMVLRDPSRRQRDLHIPSCGGARGFMAWISMERASIRLRQGFGGQIGS
jgi:hypothetical protein